MTYAKVLSRGQSFLTIAKNLAHHSAVLSEGRVKRTELELAADDLFQANGP